MKSLIAIPVVGLYLATWALTLYLFFEGNMAGGIGCGVFVLLLTLMAVKSNSQSSQKCEVSYTEFQSLREAQTINLQIIAQREKEAREKIDTAFRGLAKWQKSMEDKVASIEERV